MNSAAGFARPGGILLGSRSGALISGPQTADGSNMERTRHSRNGYQNIILSCIAGLLALGAIDRRASSDDAMTRAMGPSAALAQSGQPEAGGMINAAEQRKQIIAELRLMNTRMERIENKLASGLSVKVTDMPKGQEPKAKTDRGEKPEGKPEVKVEVQPPSDGK